ncbi:hypothetical protein AAON49_11210 [Pseudotenacibaculum sp. MALMAid0570]|uniref:hypothetical protein n=1 Tax=Pseudotenacibaculum sp. MALMAid0570 TaxID=3143938 RepID=UPI0032DFA4BB
MKKIVLLLLAFSSFVAFSQEVTLKLNYKKGDSYSIKVEMNQNLGLMGGMKMTANMNMKIVDVSAENITSEAKIKRMVVDVLQGGSTVSFDSDNVDENDSDQKMMKQQFDPMMAAVITQVMDRRGKLVSFKTEPTVPGMDNFGQQSEYPKKALKVGSTWDTEVTDNNAGTVKMSYKVSKITKTTLFADITGSASALPGSKITGMLEVDIASGNPNKMNVLIATDVQGSKITVETKVTTTKN